MQAALSWYSLVEKILCLYCVGAFGRMESDTAALAKILDRLEEQERMVKAMLEDRKQQLKGKGRPQPGSRPVRARAAQVH